MKYPLTVEALSKALEKRALAEKLSAVLEGASVTVRDALERGWFNAPSDFFDVPSSKNSYSLCKLMRVADTIVAVDEKSEPVKPVSLIDEGELAAFEESLCALAASLDEISELVDLIGAMDSAGFGIAAAPVVEYAHEKLRSMSTSEALSFLGADAGAASDDWRVWEAANDREEPESAEALQRQLMHKQALVTGQDIERVRATPSVK